jgi:conjugal transfer pilus assembly protein TraV
VKKVLIVTGMFAMSGCALLNPYNGSFSCPKTSNGKCVSVQAAYSEATKSKTFISPDVKNDEACNSDDTAAGVCSGEEKVLKFNSSTNVSSTYNRYQTSLFDKFGGLLREPVTPIVAPPKTMRVLLLPYTGQDNEFYMLRYVYFFVDEPRWLMGDSVSSGEEE